MKVVRCLVALCLSCACTVLSAQGSTPPPRLQALTETPGPTPDPRDYIQVRTEMVPIGSASFNGVPAARRAKLRAITVSGIDLTFGDGDPRQPLNQLDGSKPGNDDIASLTIIAQRVTLTRRLHLPGTNVTIIARTLRFRDADPQHPAGIDTTPIGFPTPAKPFVDSRGHNVSPGQPGLDGQSAGDIRLQVAHLDLGGPTARKIDRFVLDGGNGQDPGAGRNGTDGASRSWNNWRWKKKTFHNVIHVHYQGSFDVHPFAKKKPDWGTNAPPTNGGNAVAGGQPGRGGGGGELVTTPALANALQGTVQFTPGQPGRPTGPYRGGYPGEPRSWIKIVDDGFNAWVVARGSTRGGNGTPGKYAEAGHPGRIKGVVFDHDWLEPAVARAYLDYLSDAYLNGHIELARRIAVDYLRTVVGDGIDVQGAPRLANIHERILTLARRLHSGLDYFGNPPGWVPMLSLEVMYQNYQSQIDSAVQVLSLSHWMEAHWADVQQRRQNGEQLIQQKQADIQYYADTYRKAQDMLPFLSRELNDIQADTNDVVARLGDVEKELADKFHQDEEMRKLAKSMVDGVHEIANTWAFTGGGGPAFALIFGTSVASGLLEAKGPEGSDTATADALGKLTQQDAVAAARQRFNELSISGAKSPEALKNDLNRLSKVLASATREQITRIVSGEAATFDQQRLQEIQRRSPKFKRLFERASVLITRKILFAEKIDETYATLDAAADGIIQARADISTLRAALDKDVVQPEVKTAIEQMQRNARERLIRYKYYMVRAYEYRMLKPYPTDYRSNQLFDELARYFTPSGKVTPDAPFKTESSLYQDLAQVYRQDLEDMKDQLIREYSSYRVNSLVSQESLQLSPEELAQLNRAGEVTIDLGTRLVDPDDRNARIDRIEFSSKRTQIVDTSGRSARIELTIEPADWSVLRWQDHAYLFKYGLEREVSLARWGFNWNSSDPTQIHPFTASGDERGLIDVAGTNDRNLRVAFRPGARTLLTLRVDAHPNNMVTIRQLGLWVYVDHNQARGG